MLHFKNFSKSYGSHLILSIPELEMPPGLHWLKGQNGSGKTTLFKVLAGMLPYTGSIILDQNISLEKNPVLHRTFINFGEAEPLYPTFLTGLDLINLFTKAKKAPANQINQLIEQFNAGSYLGNSIGTYSSGMRKKLSVLLAFIGTPRIILLDEPLITLDEATVKTVYALIKEYKEHTGCSFLISSHQDIEMPELPLTATWLFKNQTVKPLAN